MDREGIQREWRRIAQRTLDAPETSPWLRNALRSALSRDVFDGANDAEILAAILRGRLDETIDRDGPIGSEA